MGRRTLQVILIAVELGQTPHSAKELKKQSPAYGTNEVDRPEAGRCVKFSRSWHVIISRALVGPA